MSLKQTKFFLLSLLSLFTFSITTASFAGGDPTAEHIELYSGASLLTNFHLKRGQSKEVDMLVSYKNKNIACNDIDNLGGNLFNWYWEASSNGFNKKGSPVNIVSGDGYSTQNMVDTTQEKSAPNNSKGSSGASSSCLYRFKIKYNAAILNKDATKVKVPEILYLTAWNTNTPGSPGVESRQVSIVLDQVA